MLEGTECCEARGDLREVTHITFPISIKRFSRFFPFVLGQVQTRGHTTNSVQTHTQILSPKYSRQQTTTAKIRLIPYLQYKTLLFSRKTGMGGLVEPEYLA
jgi:hypothetical protein